jgi:Dolichyl-phosphate-mannose-protein mannosyltransferase
MATSLWQRLDPLTAAADERKRRWTVVAGLVVAAFIGVLGPVVVAGWTGSLSIPHNDAWAYSKAAQTFARTGHIHLLGWNSMSLVGQFVPLGPLGASIKAQQCYVAALALIGLVAGFDVLRRDVGSRRAALGVLVLVSWPGFGLLSTSMMTDIPAFAALAVSLALGQRALERPSWWLWALWAIVSFWGFTVRQQTVVAPLGILGAALWPHEWRTWAAWRSWLTRRTVALIAFGAVLLLADLAFDRWRKGLADGGSPSGLIHWPGMERIVTEGPGVLLMLGLFLSPLLILVSRPSQWSWTARVTALAVFGALMLAVVGYRAYLPQDYFEMQGAYASAYLGDKPNLFPQELWDVLTGLSIVSGALLAGMVVHRLRALRTELVIVFALTLAGTMLELVAGQILFDRYLLPLVLPLAVLLLKEPVGSTVGSRPRARAGLAGVVWLALTTITTLIMLNALNYDAATWKAASAIVSRGDAKAAYVNAGFDWTAYHSSTGARGADPDAELGTFKQTPLFSDDQPCYVVAASPQPQPGWELTETPTYRNYGFFGSTGHLYVYRTAEKTCR